MKRAVLADAGPLYASVDPDDAHHKRAQQELQQLVRNKYEIVVAYPTLMEAYTLVLFRLGNSVASQWLKEVANFSLMNPSPEDYRQAFAKAEMFSDQLITLFDSLAAVMATRMGVRVWTYDHHFDLMRVAVWR
jgi:predicted nucleic acid-binding protein